MSNIKIFTDNIEKSAREQVDELLKQEAFANSKIRIMPDVHAGAGCVIGFTADLGDKVIPNIVGVDIGCGMLTAQLGAVDLDLEQLDNVIREYVPSGFNTREEKLVDFPLENLLCYEELKNIDRIEKSIGTLGGGNHFIEVDIDEMGNKYLIIHSGSRNLGKQVADLYQRKAIQALKGTDIPKPLCYLAGQDRLDYLHDMVICQEYAGLNRENILASILSHFGNLSVEFAFSTIHNYIDIKTNIVRKGAISANKDELLLIPINMRDGCIVGVGKGNEDWNCSAPHGAGRIMSRKEAKQSVSMADFQKSMEGIFTTSVSADTIDEAPMAYKPMSEIVERIGDTVEILQIIKPIYNFKASEQGGRLIG